MDAGLEIRVLLVRPLVLLFDGVPLVLELLAVRLEAVAFGNQLVDAPLQPIDAFATLDRGGATALQAVERVCESVGVGQLLLVLVDRSLAARSPRGAA